MNKGWFLLHEQVFAIQVAKAENIVQVQTTNIWIILALSKQEANDLNF